MVPARNLLRRHYDSYGGYFSNVGFPKPTPVLRSSAEFMGGMQTGDEKEKREEEEAGTSSRDAGDQCCEDRWLQLGIGDGIRPPPSSRSQAISSSAGSQREPGVALSSELEIFSSGPAPQGPVIPMFHPPSPQLGVLYPRETPWGVWTAGSLAMGVSAPAFPSPLRNFVFPMGSSASASRELRLARPPARQPAGVWFSLKAAQNQVREPFLPQISKSYLRIKDGRMTVSYLKKYLVRKLGLEDESEVEISCRGQQLLPFLTLQHVRDNIWQLRETSTSLTLVPESSRYNELLMTLQYCRTS